MNINSYDGTISFLGDLRTAEGASLFYPSSAVKGVTICFGGPHDISNYSEYAYSNCFKLKLPDSFDYSNVFDCQLVNTLVCVQKQPAHHLVVNWVAENRITPSPHIDHNKEKMWVEEFRYRAERRKKYGEIIDKYSAEKRKYLSYLAGISEEVVDRNVRDFTRQLVQLQYSAVAVEITPEGALFFEMRLVNEILHFKVIFTESEVKAFFALYQDGVCLDNGVGPINGILNHILEITHASLPGSTVATESL